MSATSWQHRGPAYTSFLNTSNSSYGAWSATGLHGLRSERKPFSHSATSRINDATSGNDIARISLVNSADAPSKEGSLPYNRDKFRAGLDYNASAPDTGNTKYNSLPSRSYKYMTQDLGLNRSQTTLSGQSNNQVKYGDSLVASEDSKASDSKPGYRTSSNTLDVMSSLSRSQSFHGFGSLRGNSSVGTYGSSLNPSSLETRDTKRPLGSPFADITKESNNVVTKALSEGIVPKPPGASTQNNLDSGRENDRPWLNTYHGRPSGSATSQPRPFTPYRTGDYLLRSDSSELSKRYGASSASTVRSHDVLEPNKDRDWYSSSQSSANSDRLYEDTYSKEYGSSNGIETVPEVVSYNAVPTRSILKKGASAFSAYNLEASRSAYNPQHSFSSLGRGLYANSTNPLPPLSYNTQPSSTLRRGTSGKRVTFNMALNRSRHFVE